MAQIKIYLDESLKLDYIIPETREGIESCPYEGSTFAFSFVAAREIVKYKKPNDYFAVMTSTDGWAFLSFKDIEDVLALYFHSQIVYEQMDLGLMIFNIKFFGEKEYEAIVDWVREKTGEKYTLNTNYKNWFELQKWNENICVDEKIIDLREIEKA
jgi:hypothetical protein